MNLFWQLLDIGLHLPQHLNAFADNMGGWLYALAFAVIFCETGLVVTPILPGDSFLFALGALAAVPGSPINVWLLAGLLVVAAIAGDAVNYQIGALFGPKVFHFERSRFFNQKHLIRTHEFYERHGGKTVVLARFIPIVRTFAPFVAGIGKMGYVRFWQFNCVGGTVWVLLFLFGGYFFGTIPVIQANFHLVAVAIVLVSLMPIGVEWLLARKRAAQARSAPLSGQTPQTKAEVEA